MLKNYLKIACRSLSKRKGYSLINILGLALGMASFILILLFVRHEFSYDQFYSDAERIHRVILHQPGNVYLGTDFYAVTPPPLATVLRENYPAVKSATGIRNRSALLGEGTHHYWEEGIWADAHYFDVFSLTLIQGEASTALEGPARIVLTESLATKIFGIRNPMNQAVTIGDEEPYTVTGIISDPPAHASIKYSFITSHLTHPGYQRSVERNIWGSSNVHTFIRLSEAADPSEFQAQLPALVTTYRYRGNTDTPEETRDQYYLQALTDIHLGPYLNFDIGFQGETQNGVKGNKTYIYLFLAIGILILLLACINYMNLAIARSIKRAQEVGLRKVVGAARKQIIGQFLTESVLIAFLALAIAMVLVEALLPFFSRMVERTLAIDYIFSVPLVVGLCLLTLTVGLFSGSYPAVFMSALSPIKMLKGKANSSLAGVGLQRFLLIGQYTASIALIVCGFVIYQQLGYMRSKDLGYDLERIVSIHIQQDNDVLRTNYNRVRDAWLQNPRVSAVTASSSLPVYADSQTEISGWDGSREGEVMQIYINPVEYGFLDLYGIKLVAGRTFSRDVPTDSYNAAIINETAARVRGWLPEEAIGKQFNEGRGTNVRTVVGVVKDFHAHSMHHEIRPMVLYLADRADNYLSSINYFAAQVRPEDLTGTIEYLKETVGQFSSYPAEFKFLDDQFEQLYSADQSFGETISFFMVLALLIASMGLFGLAAYAAEQRTKEVGVRKVLGASVGSIVILLTKEFAGLVMVAAVLATPIAYLAMHRWLEGFAYRIDIGIEVFVVSILMSFIIVVLTVGHQAFKAAYSNPTDSLRCE